MKADEEKTTVSNRLKETEPSKRRQLKVLAPLKWLGVTVGAMLYLFVFVISLMLWILQPERLTPLVSKAASSYLTADVTLDHAELTFWSTFPRLELDVKGLEVKSHVLDSISKAQGKTLPPCTDSLLSVEAFHGGINMLKLMGGKLRFYDLEITRLEANLVDYDGSHANYDIFPSSDEEEEETEFPDIAIDRFTLAKGARFRYISLADSIDLDVKLRQTDIANDGEPRYKIDIGGATAMKLGPLLDLGRLPFSVNGTIEWKATKPWKLGLKDFMVAAGPIKGVFNTSLDMEKDLRVENFEARFDNLDLDKIVKEVPKVYRDPIKDLKTNIIVDAAFKLTKPYTPSADLIPSVEVVVNARDGWVEYQGYKVDKIGLSTVIEVDGDNLDRSTVDLTRFVAEAAGVKVGLRGNLSSPIVNPHVEGNFTGNVNFKSLPAQLLAMLPCTISGTLDGSFHFSLSESDLNREGFQNILLDGDLSLRDLRMNVMEGMADVYSRRMDFNLGKADPRFAGDFDTKSLLCATLRVDTLMLAAPGMEFSGADILLAAGCPKTIVLADTTQITPISVAFDARRLSFNSEVDSMRVSLRDVMSKASIKRYNNNARLPLVAFSVDAGRLRYRDALNRISFRETNLDFTCHPRLRPDMSRRMAQTYDSLKVRYPHLRSDSIYSLAAAEMRKHRGGGMGKRNVDNGAENIDFDLDPTTRNFLKWIDFKGSLKSRKGRLFTPYFPVKNRLSDIDLRISPDSIILHNTRYRMGRSDFLINGCISDFSKALTSKRRPLRIALSLESDTIDVNEIAEAAFAGAAFAEKMDKGQAVKMPDLDDEEQMQQAMNEIVDEDDTGPLVIPMNVDAKLDIRARNIIYSDLLFHDFNGEALIYQGALNLHQLSASTDMGTIGLTALYNAPTRDDLSFSFGLNVKDLYLDKFLELMPAVDSIMPALREFKGIINADVAATTRVDSLMNIDIPTLNASLKLTGDSLVLLDAETFRTVSKWLLFKNKKRNMIDHMDVQIMIENSVIEIFPFVFDMDRYRLGVMGSNDLAMNYNYHVSVLKSPIPFKFGINVKGNPDKMKIRLGRAKFKDKVAVEKVAIADTTRINLLNQIENVFRRGVERGRINKIEMRRPDTSAFNMSEDGDTISHADSLIFIQEGLLPAPPTPPVVDEPKTKGSEKKKDKKKEKKK